MFMLVLSIGYVSAQGKADIKFDKTSHNFGTFSENDPVVSCVFTFTNVGDAPLVIHQAVASCGCTVPEYTQEPVLPGKTGTVKITYNGTGKYPGHFKNHFAHECQNRNDATLCRRRYDTERCKISIFIYKNKGEFFNSPFFLLSLKLIWIK